MPLAPLKLSQSLEDYLEMVYMLRKENGIARVKDISTALAVKMPSVAKAVLELKKLGLVTQEPYAGVELSKDGEKLAHQILNRHLLLKLFLMKLGVSEATANKDACSMEHILSAETLSKIGIFVNEFRKKGSSK
jgi:DtxR family transcriptional regulator, Mn-dependent transcriptional regulator